MKCSRRRRSTWFWVGVILLSISALFWLVVIAAAVAEVQDAGSTILAGLFLSIVFPSGRAFIVCGTAKEDTGGEYFIEGKLTYLIAYFTSSGAPSQKQKGVVELWATKVLTRSMRP